MWIQNTMSRSKSIPLSQVWEFAAVLWTHCVAGACGSKNAMSHSNRSQRVNSGSSRLPFGHVARQVAGRTTFPGELQTRRNEQQGDEEHQNHEPQPSATSDEGNGSTPRQPRRPPAASTTAPEASRGEPASRAHRDVPQHQAAHKAEPDVAPVACATTPRHRPRRCGPSAA